MYIQVTLFSCTNFLKKFLFSYYKDWYIMFWYENPMHVDNGYDSHISALNGTCSLSSTLYIVHRIESGT